PPEVHTVRVLPGGPGLPGAGAPARAVAGRVSETASECRAARGAFCEHGRASDGVRLAVQDPAPPRAGQAHQESPRAPGVPRDPSELAAPRLPVRLDDAVAGVR